MPVLTRWFIKASLIYFLAALFIGLLMAAGNIWDLSIFIRGIAPVYTHLFLLGWVSQLIFGVIYWMFPKASTQRPRGNEILAWSVFCLLNIGLILRVIAEPIFSYNPSVLLGWMLMISAILQWLAGLIFVINTWGRVKVR
jgi:cbb3-type cytochrome oxidase subunit 1